MKKILFLTSILIISLNYQTQAMEKLKGLLPRTLSFQKKESNNATNSSELYDELKSHFNVCDLNAMFIISKHVYNLISKDIIIKSPIMDYLDDIRLELYRVISILNSPTKIKNACKKLGIDIKTLFEIFDGYLPEVKKLLIYEELGKEEIMPETIIELMIENEKDRKYILEFLKASIKTSEINFTEMENFIANLRKNSENKQVFEEMNHYINKDASVLNSETLQYAKERPLRIIQYLAEYTQRYNINSENKTAEFRETLNLSQKFLLSILYSKRNAYLAENLENISCLNQDLSFFNEYKEKLNSIKKSKDKIEEIYTLLKPKFEE